MLNLFKLKLSWPWHCCVEHHNWSVQDECVSPVPCGAQWQRRVESHAKERVGSTFWTSLLLADATPQQNLALEVVCRLSQGEVSSPGFLPFSPPSVNKKRQTAWILLTDVNGLQLTRILSGLVKGAAGKAPLPQSVSVTCSPSPNPYTTFLL